MLNAFEREVFQLSTVEMCIVPLLQLGRLIQSAVSRACS